MLRTVEKQLVDFLPGGKYSKAPSKADLERTSFSHSTNLGCEHHFGDLDSSQKRRPNASMHHHTTVQLLKRNRKSLIHWLSDMPSNKKEEIMKKARKGGRVLREQNMNAEKEVEMEINRSMIEEKGNPQKRRKTNGLSEIANDPEEDYDCITNKLPVINEFSDNEYIAVAYQDQWYPGCVLKSSGPEAIVKFMAPCRRQGYFIWPAREDIQSVKKDFVLKRGFLPDCVNSGRQWYFKEHDEIDSLFRQYQNKFF
ncbi:hypothetical protein ACJMK2_011001 [Sinanodonta woodiana]|uniref:Uncharacterized protein n=1 Tax=Sinanodonta woodiana TaxID=1069815 RepID=A0ABD3V3J4_SINWO